MRQEDVYSPEELEQIQMALLGLLYYTRQHDQRELPRCFLFCRTMAKNIDICRETGYVNRAELSELLREDWRAAMERHSGLPEYYIPDDRVEVRISMARAIERQIDWVDRLIFPREMRRTAENWQ